MSIQLRGNDTSVFNNDVEVATDIQSTGQNSGQLAGFRNQLINGDFHIWQRGESFTGSSGTYSADRWYAESDSVAGLDVIRSAQVTTSFTADSILLRNSTGTIAQAIELPVNKNNEASSGPFIVGSQWTLSVYSTVNLVGTTSSANSLRFGNGVNLTTDVVQASNDSTWELVPNTTDGQFNRYRITFTIIAAPGVNNRALVLKLPAASVVGDVYYTAAQLEPGPVATPFEHRPIGVELALCQRYYSTKRIGGKQGAAIPRPGSDSKVLYENVTPIVPLRDTATATARPTAPSVFTSVNDINTSGTGIASYYGGLSLNMAFKMGVEYASTSNVSTAYGWQVTAEFDSEL